VPDVLHELSSQVGQRREHTAGNDVALDLGEPEFNLVELRGVGRSEMQVNLRMSIQKVVDLPRSCEPRGCQQSRRSPCRAAG
jgi:hypothetical protein